MIGMLHIKPKTTIGMLHIKPHRLSKGFRQTKVVLVGIAFKDFTDYYTASKEKPRSPFWES